MIPVHKILDALIGVLIGVGLLEIMNKNVSLGAIYFCASLFILVKRLDDQITEVREMGEAEDT